MPFAIFLVSLLISSSMYASSARVSQDSLVNQTLINSTAAFYTASSSAEVTWSSTKAEDSTKTIAEFTNFRTDQEGSPTTRDLFSDATSSDGGSMVMNQAVDTDSISTQVKLDTKSFVEEHELNSAEVFLYKVPPDKAIDEIRLDYCHEDKDTSCPDLIVEWFRISDTASLSFLDLESLKDKSSDLNQYNTCLDISEMNAERCVVQTQQGSSSDLDVISNLDETMYQRRIVLNTLFPGNHYLFRFRTRDKSPIHFRLMGVRGGKEAPLPTAYFESDEVGQTQASFRRIRQQQAVSGGLQDGLEYVHYAHQLESK